MTILQKLAWTVLVLLVMNGSAVLAQPAQSAAVSLDVHKSPTCGCCSLWIDHLQHAGVKAHGQDHDDLNPIKQKYRIDPQYQSCHTAVSQRGFVFEGHVPARFIKSFLAAPPKDAIGLAVPGMPLGSPGMEVDNRFTPYQVLLLKADGSSDVFAHVNSPADQ
jgi:hypothetical protein